MAIAERPAPRARPAEDRRPRRERDEELLVWPDLVFVEFICAVLFTISLLVLSTLISGPLLGIANPDATPNPSKAPWYFLNLQELLLHMHPALAGVIVPTIFLILLAAMPYFDRSNEGQGVWFGTPDAKRITAWTAISSFVVTLALIFYNESLHAIIAVHFGLMDAWPEQLRYFLNTRALQSQIPWPDWAESIPYLPFEVTLRGDSFQNLDFPAWLVEQFIPILAMVGLPILFLVIVRGWIGRLTKHDAMIVLFTGFITVWVLMTIIGTAFRGPGQQLLFPWDNPAFMHPIETE